MSSTPEASAKALCPFLPSYQITPLKRPWLLKPHELVHIAEPPQPWQNKPHDKTFLIFAYFYLFAISSQGSFLYHSGFQQDTDSVQIRIIYGRLNKGLFIEMWAGCRDNMVGWTENTRTRKAELLPLWGLKGARRRWWPETSWRELRPLVDWT